MRRAARAAAVLIGLAMVTSTPALPDGSAKRLGFEDLKGWDVDDHALALSAFQASCPVVTKARPEADWQTICAVALDDPDPKTFFETFFLPVQIGDPKASLFTGYYEPELSAALAPSARHSVPIYAAPPELRSAPKPWASRAQIENDGILTGRGLEIAWLEDPVEKFFLQIQGSGRLRLPDGTVMRVGFGGKNGHEYRSVGKELVRRGIYEPHQVSAQVIKNWVRRNPDKGRTLLQHNPSYVFFRKVQGVTADQGPLGAMQVPLTAGRSLAIDPAFAPLGAPVWLEKGGASPFNRLMVAQDTGSAIKGTQRGDVFYGSGDQAGRQAGRIRDAGRMVVLLPIEAAYALDPGY